MNTGKKLTDEELSVLKNHLEIVNKHWIEYENKLMRKVQYEERLLKKYGCDTRHYPHPYVDINGTIHEGEL